MLNHRPLITGDVLNIRVKPEDVEKTRLMIEIQWLALKMVAFCAAAEVIDELDSEPPHLQRAINLLGPRRNSSSLVERHSSFSAKIRRVRNLPASLNRRCEDVATKGRLGGPSHM